MDCWREPIAHIAEDRHLRRESLDDEAGELMVPAYKFRKELIAYNESIYEAHKGECSQYSQVHEAMPCARVYPELKWLGERHPETECRFGSPVLHAMFTWMECEATNQRSDLVMRSSLDSLKVFTQSARRKHQ